MVPQKLQDIQAALTKAIDRLQRQIERDRLSMSLHGGAAAPEGQIRLQALADAADELQRRLAENPASGDDVAPEKRRSSTDGVNADE